MCYTLISYYLFTERHKGQKSHLEVLDAEWYADYGYAAEETKGQMQHSDLDTTYKYPYYIHYDGQAASIIRIRLYLTAERP